MPVPMIPPPMPSNGSTVQMNGARPRERKRLRAWLQDMVDSGLINGLEWLNRDSQIIKIPWKHAARHGYSRERDACLFKEWAIHTGKYNPETDRARPKTWKANFRCAINSLPDIVEIKDLGTKRGNNAFKVYKINPKRPKARPKQKIVTAEPTTTGHTPNPKKRPPRKPTAPIPNKSHVPCSRNENTKSPAMPWIPTSSYQTQNEIRSGWPNTRYPVLLTPDHPPTTTVYTHDNHPNQYSPPISAPPYPSYTDPHHWQSTHIKPEPITIRNPEPSYNPWPETEQDQISDCSSTPTDEEIIQMTLDMQENSPISSPTSYEQTDWVPSTFGDKQYLSNELTVTRPTGMTSPIKTAFPTSTSPPAYPIKSERDSRFLLGGSSMTAQPGSHPLPPPYRPPTNFPQTFGYM